MLRIKDSVDLKELEEFGFKYVYQENIVVNFIDDIAKQKDNFIKEQIIDNIIHNGKQYNVVNIKKSRIKELLENGFKYKQFEDEIKRFKFESENIQKAIQHVDEAKYNAQQDDIEFFVKQAKQEDAEILLLKKALMIATKRANRLNTHCDELKGIYNSKFPYSDEIEYERAIKIAKKELNILEKDNK